MANTHSQTDAAQRAQKAIGTDGGEAKRAGGIVAGEGGGGHDHDLDVSTITTTPKTTTRKTTLLPKKAKRVGAGEVAEGDDEIYDDEDDELEDLADQIPFSRFFLEAGREKINLQSQSACARCLQQGCTCWSL